MASGDRCKKDRIKSKRKLQETSSSPIPMGSGSRSLSSLSGLYKINFFQKPFGFSVIMDMRGNNAIISSSKRSELKLGSRVYKINGIKVDGMKYSDIVCLLRAQNVPLIVTFKESEKKSDSFLKYQSNDIDFVQHSSLSYDSDEYEEHVFRHIIRRKQSRRSRGGRSSLLRSEEIHLWNEDDIQSEAHAMLKEYSKMRQSLSQSSCPLVSDYQSILALNDNKDESALSDDCTVIVNIDASRDEKCIQAFENGVKLLKYGRYGKPKWKTFRLTQNHCHLVWKSQKKSAEETRILLSEIREILIGTDCQNMNKKVGESVKDKSFMIFYGERYPPSKWKMITLTAENEESASLCVGVLRKVSKQIV